MKNIRTISSGGNGVSLQFTSKKSSDELQYIDGRFNFTETVYVKGAPIGGGTGGLVTEDLTLDTGISIKTSDSNLVSHDKTSPTDPLFPNVDFMELGQAGSAINISSVLFEPLVLKNDTAIQGYDSTYSFKTNMISVSADDKMTVGDGAMPTAIRAVDAAADPVVRQGVFGATTDYKIYHEGNYTPATDLDIDTGAQVIGTSTWADGNPLSEDRTNLFVKLQNGQLIKCSTVSCEPIGITDSVDDTKVILFGKATLKLKTSGDTGDRFRPDTDGEGTSSSTAGYYFVGANTGTTVEVLVK